jgi:2'-5' RNA ligase
MCYQSLWTVQVLFLQVAPGAGLVQLHRLNDAVTAAFRAAGLYKEQEAFQPHATIAKMSKLYNKQRRTVGKRFPAAAYAGLGDMEGGRVAVEQVVLCRMQGRRQGMFYPVDGCVRLL